MKTIRIDDERGEFLGLIGFDRFVRSAVHQHQGVASSFILEGGLTDYHGPVNQHEMGINFRGSTHDAMSYVPTVLVSKLEGPVTYPKSEQLISGIHAGSTYPISATPTRRTARDQRRRRRRGAGADRHRGPLPPADLRLCRQRPRAPAAAVEVRPETTVPAWQAGDWVELWVRGGEIESTARRRSRTALSSSSRARRCA